MKILLYIIAAIFLFFTAPIWVPAVGILGLATGLEPEQPSSRQTVLARRAGSSGAPAPSPPTFVAAAPAATNPPAAALLPAPGGTTRRLFVGLRSPGLPRCLRVGRKGA